MPPVRKTRGAVAKTEPSPEVELVLKDFDAQVAEKVEWLQNEGELLVAKITAQLENSLLKMPKSIRQMNLMEFLEQSGNNGDANGTILGAGDVTANSTMIADQNSTMFDVTATDGLDSTKLAPGELSFALPKIPSPKRKVKGGKKPLKQNGGFGNGLVTPMNRNMINAAPTDDPSMFTPATALRAPRLGEICTSVRGSPVMINTALTGGAERLPITSGVCATIVKEGKVELLTGSPLNPENLPDITLTEESRQELEALQTKLSAILKK